jgi:hypothetical protein
MICFSFLFSWVEALVGVIFLLSFLMYIYPEILFINAMLFSSSNSQVA